MKKSIIVMVILAAFLVPVTVSAGWFGNGQKTEMKVGFVNMNEAGLNEISRQVNEYGKQLAEKKGFAVLQEELKKTEEAARNTSEAVQLREKIKPLLEAWENMEKAGGSGNADEIKVAEEKFQKLMSDSELTEAYAKFHNLVDSNKDVAIKRKELADINNEIMAEINKKRVEWTDDFYQKIKTVSSEIAQNKYSVILGVTEFFPDGKKILKKTEILYCDKNYMEDLTEKITLQMKFFKAD